MSSTRNIIGLLVWIVIAFIPSIVGSQFMPDQWYRDLQKPSWNPPGWVFGPVWTLLYLLMGVSAWLIWRHFGFAAARLALSVFLIQLGFNGAWTWIFFGLHNIGAALIEIIVLWVLILATLIAFWQKSAVAGSLLIPYLAWVSFASFLTFTIWRLNS